MKQESCSLLFSLKKSKSINVFKFLFLRLLGRQIDEIIIKERCYKYLCDLYNLIWDEDGVLRKRKAEPTSQQREETRAKLLNSLIDIMPCMVLFLLEKLFMDFYCAIEFSS